MSTHPKHRDTTDPLTIELREQAASGYVPAIVALGIERADADWHHAAQINDGDDLDHAARATRLAAICDRRARWWHVLVRWTYRPSRYGHTMPRVYGCAAHAARARELSDVRFWTELAADWRARADRRPTSDAAGALSNWAELGVTA